MQDLVGGDSRDQSQAGPGPQDITNQQQGNASNFVNFRCPTVVKLYLIRFLQIQLVVKQQVNAIKLNAMGIFISHVKDRNS